MIQRREFASLQSLAIELVSRNYSLYPELTGLPERVKESIIDKSTEYAGEDEAGVLLTSPHIQQEKYWKACCHKNKRIMSSLKLQDHGFSYKIAFIEKYIAKLIQSTENYQLEKHKILPQIKIAAPWVFTLELKINAQDLNLEQICKYLSNLISLKIKCSEGKNNDFKKNILGIKFSEARDLSQVLRSSQSLIYLNFAGNLIDDELFKFVYPGLLLNTSLIELNLSYNKIGNEGARKISKFLIRNQILTHLNLSSNLISYEGSRFLAQALKLNSTLQNLSLRLNSIDDRAGAKLFKDLAFNTNLKALDLEANLLSTMTVRKLCLYLQVSNSLREILIGSNNFIENDYEVISDMLPTEKARDHFRKSKFAEIRI